MRIAPFLCLGLFGAAGLIGCNGDKDLIPPPVKPPIGAAGEAGSPAVGGEGGGLTAGAGGVDAGGEGGEPAAGTGGETAAGAGGAVGGEGGA